MKTSSIYKKYMDYRQMKL